MKSVRTNRLLKREGIVLFLLFLFVASHAQNLVPNSGFEEHVNDRVTFWQQPKGEYYHYESHWLKRKGKSKLWLDHVNGICLLNRDLSEFLEVELKEPLQEDVVYTISMEAMVYFKDREQSMDGIRTIDCKFYAEEMNVGTRIYIKDEPDISFDAMDIHSYYDPVILKKTYKAHGGERYLVIGKFHSPSFYPSNYCYDSVSLAYKEAKKQIDQVMMTEMMKANDALMTASKKKAMRIMYKRHKGMQSWLVHSTDSIKEIYQPILDSLAPLVRLIPYADVRIYFDNVSVVPEGGVTDQMEYADSDMPFNPGETYRFNHVVFDTDKDILKSESFIELDNLAEILLRYKGFNIELTGHTDNVNSEEYNRVLSRDRAEACKGYLIKKGVAAKRIITDGKGETMPLGSNDTEEGRAMNRRVEFRLRGR